MLKTIPLILASSVALAGGNSLQYSNNVPQDQQALINSDLNRLAGMQINVTDPAFGRVLDFGGPVTSSTMLVWLGERIHYVLGDDFSLTSAVYVENKAYAFQNPGILPDLPTQVKQPDAIAVNLHEEKKVVTVMSNVGGALYIAGKQAGALLGLNIPGIGKIPASSPRIGILQVGPGLFKVAPRKEAQVGDLDSSLMRLGTLFHEARHSDGNGKSIAMFHAVCPDGHAYAGYAACDFSLNGSYSVGGQVDKVLTESCTECNTAQREGLRLNYLDSFSRVITEKTDANGANQREIALLEAIKPTCDKLKELNVDTIEQCKNIDQQIQALKAANGNNAIKAAFLDSRPEGTIEKHRGIFGF